MNLSFRKTGVVCRIVLLCATLTFGQNFVDVKPIAQQVAWQDLDMRAIIQFGPNSIDREQGEETADPPARVNIRESEIFAVGPTG